MEEQKSLNLEELQEKVDRWIQTIGNGYFSELTNMSILMEEVGELARYMARIYGEQSFKKTISDQEAKEKCSDEMADILWVLLCLANQTETNLMEAFHKNLQKKTQRDRKRHAQNPKLNERKTE